MNKPGNFHHTQIWENPGWRRLRLFNYYRGALALLLLTIHLNGLTELLVPPEILNPSLFYIASIFYIVACVIFMLSIHQRKPGLDIQVMLQTVIDITAIITLMHAAGGVRSGLGMLLIINISITSLFLRKRLTLLFAAATSLAILGEQIYSQISFVDFNPAYTQAGILGTLIFVFAFLTSNTARRLRETELLASQQSRALESAVQMNEHIIRNMRTGIMVITQQGVIQMANKAAETLLGNVKLEPMQNLHDVFPALYDRFTEWQNNRQTVMQSPVPQSHGLPDIQPGFSKIEPYDDKDGRVLIFLEDASQLNQRFQQVKLASLGRLTASIAHEIRNPLAAINHAAQLLNESTDKPEDTKLTKIINTQANRLNSIVENVMQLSRQQRATPETIALKTWLQQCVHEFCSHRGLQIEQVDIDIQPEDTSILFDANNLRQVLWNLCSNAIYHSGLPIDALRIDLHGGVLEESGQVYIDISDNGTGIGDEIEQQIFEPFFTTSTKGTGLGLYITKEVVESNRAKIHYMKPNTGGSCFRIYFIPAH